VRKPEQLVGAMPVEDRLERVGTGDEEQLRVRPEALPQIVQRVDRVRRTLPVDVDAADREPRVRGSRDDRHQIAVLSG
jgi:hypothetical protein